MNEANTGQEAEGLVLALPANQKQENLNSLLPSDLLHIMDSLGNDVGNSLPSPSSNLQIGFMIQRNSIAADPVLEKFTIKEVNADLLKSKNVDLIRLWGRLVSPLGDPARQIPITLNWAPFFTSRLVQKGSFYWAKEFLNSQAWNIIQQEESSLKFLKFSLPFECPQIEEICSNEYVAEHSEIVAQSEPQTPEQATNQSQPHSSILVLLPKKRKDMQIHLVDTDLRRSLRIKAYNTGFKPAGRGRKNYLGCDQDPPSLSTKVIRNLGESFCKLSPEYLTDDTLKKRKTTKKPLERKRLFRRWSGRSSPRLSQLKAIQMDARSSRKRRPQRSDHHPLEGISITEYSLRLTLISYLNLALLRDSIYFLYVIMAT
jgi:hypothetical protein